MPDDQPTCPAESLLKTLSGKWKARIFRIATTEPLRFNALLRTLDGASKQSLTLALREMEAENILEKRIIRAKPLHIEYHLTDKGRALIPIFRQLENLS